MTQDEIKEVYINLFLTPEAMYLDAQENKLYYIDENDDFKVFHDPAVKLSDCNIDTLEYFAGKLKLEENGNIHDPRL